MTWYRVALADGYTQAPLVASPWVRDEQLPEPLHWAWIADNGDLITRAGKGLYRISFANNQSTWFQDVDCRLQAWPEGNSEAPMVCNDGKQRTMQIPGNGVVVVDDIQYVRVFNSERDDAAAAGGPSRRKADASRAGRHGDERCVHPAARGSQRAGREREGAGCAIAPPRPGADSTAALRRSFPVLFSSLMPAVHLAGRPGSDSARILALARRHHLALGDDAEALGAQPASPRSGRRRRARRGWRACRRRARDGRAP